MSDELYLAASLHFFAEKCAAIRCKTPIKADYYFFVNTSAR